jgi:hypothetical protein
MYGLVSEESAVANVFGGTLGYMNGFGSSTINIFGGNIMDELTVQSNFDGVINVYGYDFLYDPTGGNWNDGLLTGLWADKTPFSIDLRNVPSMITYDHVDLHVIPAPTAVVLATVGLSLVGWRLRQGQRE